MKRTEVYISVDIEASGPIPGEYSMLSLGACAVYDTSKTFYREFKPINDNHLAQAIQVTGLSMEKLRESGVEPETGMSEFKNWIDMVSKDNRPVFIAFNATFDWMFVAYYFHRFLECNPFRISGLDIKAYYMGKFGTSWSDTAKRRMDSKFLSDKKHTHNALDDAIEQAEIFRKILEYKR
ncbi:MAG: 3'-5' exonuclease [Nitrosotalea sp.]